MPDNDWWTPSGERFAVTYRMTSIISNTIDDRITVRFYGWALAYASKGFVWIDGVHPGACTASGTNMEEAMEDLHNTLGKILFDIAASSDKGFEDFARTINAFVSATDEPTLKDWNAVKGDAEENPFGVSITLEQAVLPQASTQPQRHPFLEDNPNVVSPDPVEYNQLPRAI